MFFEQISNASQPLLYLDPGSGSLLVQIFLGAFFAVGVAAKLFWSRISGLFGGNKSVADQAGDEEDDE